MTSIQPDQADIAQPTEATGGQESREIDAFYDVQAYIGSDLAVTLAADGYQHPWPDEIAAGGLIISKRSPDGRQVRRVVLSPGEVIEWRSMLENIEAFVRDVFQLPPIEPVAIVHARADAVPQAG